MGIEDITKCYILYGNALRDGDKAAYTFCMGSLPMQRPYNDEMNITLKRRGMILLLVAGLTAGASALAQSRHQHPSFGGFFAQDNRQRQNDNRREMDDRRFNDREAGRQQRRGERLSPDERRMLRQQIDEAGRDIYAPRRR